MQSDLQLRDDILAELDFEPSIDASGIGVAVKNGVVTLSGHAPSYAQKIAAERAAQRVKGVRAVAMDIEVRFPNGIKQADDEIAGRAANILSWSISGVKNIKTVVDSGWITLTGQVDYYYQKQEAERAVRKLSGVMGVTNQITVKPSVSTSDIRLKLSQALQRNADLEASKVNIAVDGGHVTLSGNVRAWYERQIAENAAWAVPGVTQVTDKLTLQ